MPTHGALSAVKSYVPQPIKTSLNRARKSLRQRLKVVSRRLNRPNLYRLTSPERVGAVYSAHSDMRVDERVFLYAFVRGFRPERALEIGVAEGGSALIITNAMEESGRGLLVGVDPAPRLLGAWKDLHGRYKLISQPSPEAIPEARAAAGGPFDFVLIDGLHRYDSVQKDIVAILPHLADGAYLLFHDAFHYGVATAVREAIEANPSLVDCGYPCRTANVYADPATPYNGFRLLRWTAAAVAPRSVDVVQVVDPLYAQERRTRPPMSADVLNHDIWYCRVVSPCPYCRAKRESSVEMPNDEARMTKP
jgi:predicted O-methyltransferase YrrM